MAKTDDDPERVRPPQRGNDEKRKKGQKKNILTYNCIEIGILMIQMQRYFPW